MANGTNDGAVREAIERDLYAEAIVAGTREHLGRVTGDYTVVIPPQTGPDTKEYWIARAAARGAAMALLAEAERLGLSAEDRESLRKVAAAVAYD